MKLGFIGLGKMGRRMVNKLLTDGHELVVWNRSRAAVDELLADFPQLAADSVLTAASTPADLVKQLTKTRIIWLMLPAGEPTETMLGALGGALEPEDILIDGGNSHFKDTERRFRLLADKKIRFLGIGVSGGIIAERQGYPLMAGGDNSAYEHVKPVLTSLAKPGGGFAYFGPGGSGHFVKMVHNGIEYGIMQSLGEGFEVLYKAPYKFDLLRVARLYQKGTLVSGFMLDRAVEVFEKDPALTGIRGVIAESGEARWTVAQAEEEGVDAEIIRRSLDFRARSQTEAKVQESFAAKMVAALRNAFGGHDVQRK